MTTNDKPEETTEEKPRKRKKVRPGWYRDMENEEYHRGTLGTSSSELKKYLETTAERADYEKRNPPDPSPNMALGSAFHTLTLEPDQFEKDIAILPNVNRRTKAGKEEEAEFRELHGGKVLITESQYNKAQAMAESVRSHPIARVLVDDLIVESSVYWWYRSMDPDDDTEFKELAKVRPDGLSRSHPVIVDLKSAKDATFSGFGRDALNYYYHLSAAFYLEGVNQCKPLLEELGFFAFTKFIFIVVENTAPYSTAVYELSEDDREIGKTLFRRAMHRLKKAREENYPGFPEEIRVLELPGYKSRAHIV